MAHQADIQAEMQTELQNLRQAFEKKMTEANGDPTVIQKASEEFQSQVQAVMAKFEGLLQKTVQSAAREAEGDDRENLYSKELSSLDLNALAYRGDRNQFHALLSDRSVGALVAELKKRRAGSTKHKDLLSRAFRLTRQMAPQLFEIYSDITERLGIKLKVDLYSVQGAHFNASCISQGDGTYAICFTSGLLEKFNREELAFVIGHELGHALFNHFDISVGEMLNTCSHLLTPVQMIKLCAWERAGEISADRIGLLAAGGFAPAATSFFKLSSGIASDRYQFEMDDYMQQYSDLATFLKSSQGPDVEDIYSSHPFNPIRLKALELFSRSGLFLEQIEVKRDGLEMPEVEKEIMSFVKLMEPGYLDDNSDVGAATKEFLFLTGFLVANADGQVDDVELRKLASFLDSQTMETMLSQVRDLHTEELIKRTVDLSSVVDRNLPLVSKLNLVRDLITIVLADGKIVAGEVHVLENVCNLLGIKAQFIVDSIDRMVQKAA